MNGKEKLKNDIMVGMMRHLDAGTMAILENVVVRAMQEIEIVITETLPATISDTNQYIIDLFMARKAGKLKERTVAAYMSTVREFIAFIHKPLNKVSECDVECYLYQKRINCENVSLNNLRRNLSAFFTWMRRVKLISDNPCDGVEPYIQVEKPIDHLEVVDVEKIKEGCRNKRDRAILEFLRSTAMRRGEVPLVHINDINFLTGKIVIYGGKSNRYRTVMLDKLALHFINEYLKERGVTQQSTEPLFTHLRGDKTKALDEGGIYAAIKSIARRSKIDRRVYPHLFRKTTGTNICRRGGSEEAAGEYLGHAPRNVTRKHYISKSDQYVEQIFRNYVEAI